MAKFPRIDSPCPYRANLSAIIEGDHCRMCHRDVFDLTAMTDGDRGAFLAGCEGDVCVKYSISVRPSIAAAAMAAAALAMPAGAMAQVQPVAAPDLAVVSPTVEADDMILVMGGGIRDPKHAELVDNPLDAQLPAIPVVYEEETVPAPPVG